MEGQGHTGVSGKARTQSPGSTARAFKQSRRFLGIFLGVNECTLEAPSPGACCVPGTELHI